MEPRYYGQVPFRGCSLMVKPQSSKLITRVRFPSSPPLQRLRRKRRGLLRSRDDGNPFRMRICFLARSESARSSSSSPPQILFKVAGNRLRAKIHSLARSESAHSSLLIHTPQAPAAPRQSWRIHRATPQHCRGVPSPGKENPRHHQKAQRLRRHPQQEPPENHNLPPSAQW